MTRGGKVDRARRNALKAVGLTLGVVFASSAPHKKAAAGWHDHGGGCFARGTPIRTRDGYRPIESLKAGDEVAVRFAGFAPITDIESFTVSHSAGEWVGAARPVRVKRGALGANMPMADLCLTAAHAVLVEGLLVPLGDVVNGTSIVFATADDRDSIDFFHIGFARHDVLDAAGAPCESLRLPSAEPCAPVAGFNGGRDELGSRVRSAMSLIVDGRRPIDIIRDDLEERGLTLAKAA
jgi:hypothetical protein